MKYEAFFKSQFHAKNSYLSETKIDRYSEAAVSVSGRRYACLLND